ncbi:hypothetical protein EUX98_g8554 [Antrodiella citrinella]|uniref:Uncharacterized protein n=1 Tax=Antrodiella citrinella TaxID=2447956 RepID=A0A4V3XG97_9APHY|nr:hypothetical protein EUX98_g8554 [Antrodiella citrinella]
MLDDTYSLVDLRTSPSADALKFAVLEYNDVEVRYANDVKRACRKLSLSVGKGPVVPSADDLTLAEFVLTLTFQEPLLVARTVCRAANAWNLLALWERAMKAVETWHNVAVSAGDAASNAQLNDVLPWVSHARESSVQSLCELRHGDSSLFVKLSLIHGNIGFLRDSILPRIEDAVLLRDFATRVYDDPNLAKITSKTIQTEIASLIMSKALSLTSFTMKSGSAKIGLELVKRYLEPCMSRFHNLLPVIFQKVASVTSLTSSEAHQQIYDVMIPLLEDVAQYVQSHPGAADSLPSMVKYLNFTLGVFVKRVKAPLKYTTSRKSIWALVTAMTLPGGLETLVALSQSLVDALSPMHCHLFIKSMSNHADYLLFPTDHTVPNASSLMSALLTKYSETAVLSKSEEVIDSLQFCLVRRALVPTCADNIIKRILEPRCLLLPEYVDNILAPSILDLRELARTHNLVDHFMPTLRTIVLTWFEKVFQAQRKPQIDESAPLCVALSRFCTCQLCTPIRSFFQDQSKLELRVLAPVIGTSRRHVEEQVKRAGREMLSLTKNLEGLRITKSENVYWTMRWHAVQARGLAILHAASDTRAGLEHMLGTQFSTISALVGYDSSSGSMDGETRPAKRRRVTQDPTVIYTIGKSTLYGSTSMTLDFTKA